MKKEYSQLLDELRIESLPARWEQIYEDTMREYDTVGCPALTPEFYDRLNRDYGMLDGLVDVYKSAAAEIAKNEPLSRLLAILIAAERDRTAIYGELSQFKAPKPRDGESADGYNMLGAIATAAMADFCYEKLLRRGIPEEHHLEMLTAPEKNVRSYMSSHEGRPGYNLFAWNQHYIDAKIYSVGRLHIHVDEKFKSPVSIYKNRHGEAVFLADGAILHKSGYTLGSYLCEDADGSFKAEITEGDGYVEGYPYTKMGNVAREPVRLDAEEWTKFADGNDYVIKLHIPASGRLDDESVNDSLRRALDFVDKHYPDQDYKGFSCYSWLCDPQIITLLGEGANISKFCKRFQPLTVRSNGRSVFKFVYKKEAIEFADIPEDTSLGRALKKHYLNGGAIYDMRGFFFKDDVKR